MNRFIIICAIILTAAPVAAFAQAGSTGGMMGDQPGSTGGTIGKQNKEASGSEVSVPPHARRAQAARQHHVAAREYHVAEARHRRREAKASAARSTRCPNIVGVWNSWASFVFGQADTTFYKNGTWTHKSGQGGKYWCKGGEFRSQKPGAAVERWLVTPDGRSISFPNGSVIFSR